MSTNQQVKDLYEQLPYPPRDPENEKTQLIRTAGDSIEELAHYCFKGRLPLEQEFNCLVAGAGTGDSVIYLAEQLRGSNAKVTYLDMSTASMAIAQKRAQVRQLDNIEWVTGTIEQVNELSIGPFDYINCSGVLHHLKDPDYGLKQLASVLKSHGAIFLMLYGQYGRRAIYETQSLLQLLHGRTPITNQKIALTRQLIQDMPITNPLKKEAAKWSTDLSTDAGLCDLLLHPQDRAYTVPQIYQMAETASLNFINYSGPYKKDYNPRNLIKSPPLLEKVLEKDSISQQAFCELMHGGIIKHFFYLSKQADSEAKPSDKHYKIILSGEMAGQHQTLHQQMVPGQTLTIDYQVGLHTRKFTLHGTPELKQAVKYFDGQTSIASIVKKTKLKVKSSSEAKILSQVLATYELFNSMSWAFLTE